LTLFYFSRRISTFRNPRIKTIWPSAAGRAVRGSLFAHTLTAHFVRYKGTLRAATISLAARFASFLPQS
jgi:hypothetical protein